MIVNATVVIVVVAAIQLKARLLFVSSDFGTKFKNNGKRDFKHFYRKQRNKNEIIRFFLLIKNCFTQILIKVCLFGSRFCVFLHRHWSMFTSSCLYLLTDLFANGFILPRFGWKQLENLIFEDIYSQLCIIPHINTYTCMRKHNTNTLKAMWTDGRSSENNIFSRNQSNCEFHVYVSI